MYVHSPSPCILINNDVLTLLSPQGSLNKYHGRHHLGNRARKLDEGILVVRFEMPFDVWCAACPELIPHGRRFNAEKKQVGKYYSSPIFGFRFKCNNCSNYIEIRTDPQNHDFTVAEGGKRKVEASEADEEEEDGRPLKYKTAEDHERLNDPFSRLEHAHDDAERGKVVLPQLEQIEQVVKRRSGDSVAANRLLRSVHRVERRKQESLIKEAEDRGLAIVLLPHSTEDEQEARAAMKKSVRRAAPGVVPKVARSIEAQQRQQSIASIFGNKRIIDPAKSKLLATLQQRGASLSLFQPKKNG